MASTRVQNTLLLCLHPHGWNLKLLGPATYLPFVKKSAILDQHFFTITFGTLDGALINANCVFPTFQAVPTIEC